MKDDDEVMLITDGGTLIRTAVDGISIVGRNTQGVRLIRIGDDEKLVELERVATPDKDVEDEGTDEENSAPDDSSDNENTDTSEIDSPNEE